MCPLSDKSKIVSLKVWETIHLDKKSLLKYFLILVYLTLLLSLAFTTVALTILYEFYHYEYVLKNEFCGPTCYSLVLGIFMIFFTLFGLIIVINKKFGFIKVYIFALGVIFFLEIAAGLKGSFVKIKTEEILEKSFRDSLPKYVERNQNVIKVWDKIQNTFNCCGIHSYEDWMDHIGKNESLPLSCCYDNKLDGGEKCIESSPDFRFIGCLHGFAEHIKHYFTCLEIVGYGAAIIQVVLIVFGLIIQKEVKRYLASLCNNPYDQEPDYPNNKYVALRILRNGNS